LALSIDDEPHYSRIFSNGCSLLGE